MGERLFLAACHGYLLCVFVMCTAVWQNINIMSSSSTLLQNNYYCNSSSKRKVFDVGKLTGSVHE